MKGRSGLWLVLILVMAALATAWSFRRPALDRNNIWVRLRTSEHIELLSIDPMSIWDDPNGPGPKSMGRKILGSLLLTGAERDKLVDALHYDVDHAPGYAPACFEPRHTLRFVDGGSTYDVVICFQCLQVAVVRKDSADEVLAFRTNEGAAPEFKKVLTNHHVPLPESHSEESDTPENR